MTLRTTSIIGLFVLAALAVDQTFAAEEPPRRRVLITNDNGIDDPKLVALARAFAVRADTWVVAPTGDRSGSGAYLTVTRLGRIEVSPRELGEGIKAFAVDGFPADCVVVALLGLMKDAPPDLVVAGINGGPNLGAEWMFSGTIGAARVAAFAGIPAMAVSGLDDDFPGSVEAVAGWVERLAWTDAVLRQQPGEYITVSVPRLAPDEISGPELTDRAPLIRIPELRLDEDQRIWRVTGRAETGLAPAAGSDESVYGSGSIAIVPMRVEEVDTKRLLQWRQRPPELPPWDGATEAEAEQ